MSVKTVEDRGRERIAPHILEALEEGEDEGLPKLPSVDEPANAYTCQRQGGDDRPARYLHRVLHATLISSRAAVCIQQLPILAWSNEMSSFRSFFEQLVAAYGCSAARSAGRSKRRQRGRVSLASQPQ